jgi:hypothetical protein
MCTKCLPTESVEQHKARHPGAAKHGNDPLYCFKGHKMLYQINKGEIVYVVGRLLQPFCSHALYRVRVLDLHSVGNDCLVIHGTLIDFRDSPVRSHAIPQSRLFRWEATDACGDLVAKLSREDIERILREQGISVRFREYKDTTAYVEAIGPRRGKRRSFGKLSDVELMSEEDLASMVRAKFSIETREEAEKCEVMQ